MAIDPTPLGAMVARLMEDLEREYGPSAKLVDAMVVVEVAHNGELDEDLELADDDDGYSAVQARILSGRNTAGVGLGVRILRALLP